MGAHPRDCGERSIGADTARKAAGSSPRLRGTRYRDATELRVWGLIPATAGNARRPSMLRTRTRAHPRDCGERRRSVPFDVPAMGSSPRLRGTLSQPHNLIEIRGLIPATAGNATARGGNQSWDRAHPRDCGERSEYAGRKRDGSGSSPRLRGTQHDYYPNDVDLGLIPATAGNA